MTTDADPRLRTVLVTGSTSGIGAATARLLAARGWLVVVTGRVRGRDDGVVDDIVGVGGQAVFVPSNLGAGADELRAFASFATGAAGGRIDSVVHNAALCPAYDTLSLADSDLEATLAVNVRAPTC